MVFAQTEKLPLRCRLFCAMGKHMIPRLASLNNTKKYLRRNCEARAPNAGAFVT